MWKIAICDDEKKAQQDIKEVLNKYLPAGTYQLYCFDNGEVLLQEAKSIHFDLIYLDIVLPGMNGVDVARALRETGCDATIIFLTNYDDYLEVGYEVQAFRYRFKPIDTVVFRADLDAWQKQCRERNMMIQMTTVEGVYQVAIDDITAVEVAGRKVQVRTTVGVFLATEPMHYWEQLLPASQFLEPYNKILVNSRHVKFFDQTKVVIVGDVVLPMSRRKYAAFKTAMMS